MSGGSSSGMVKTFVAGSRVCTGVNKTTGRLTESLYTPSFLRAGDQKKISAKSQIPVLVNLYNRTEPVHMSLIAWGGRADLFAKNLNQGKEMSWELEPRSYWSDLYYSDGTLIMDRDGSKKTVRQTSYTIVDFGWGSDSQLALFEEINHGIKTGEGRRPANWNVANHPDNALWIQMLNARKAHTYMGGDRFGFARVIYPKDGGIILLGDQSYSAARAAGGEQALIQATMAAGNIIQLTPGQKPEPRVTGQPGGAMFQGGNVPMQGVAGQWTAPRWSNVPIEQQVAGALATNGSHCVKCGTKISEGVAFCGSCGTQVVLAHMVGGGGAHQQSVNV